MVNMVQIPTVVISEIVESTGMAERGSGMYAGTENGLDRGRPLNVNVLMIATVLIRPQ